MLSPLKHLKGKLNHIKLPQIQLMRVYQTANAIRGSGISLQNDSIDDILELKSQSVPNIMRRYHKFQFQFMVHNEQAAFGQFSTIFDKLSAHQRKINYVVSAFTSILNTRQLTYLNLAIRSKINQQLPNWNKLHLTPQCPFKQQIEIVPILPQSSHLQQLKGLEKKGVMQKVIEAKG